MGEDIKSICSFGKLKDIKKYVKSIEDDVLFNFKLTECCERAIIGENDLDIIKYLVSSVEVDDYDDDLNEVFSVACSYNRIDVVKYLMTDERIDISHDNSFDFYFACDNNYVEIVELLLSDDRINPTVINNYAIRQSAAHGHYGVVKLLLNDDRVDPTARNNLALFGAADNQHNNIVRLLLQDKRVLSALNIQQLREYRDSSMIKLISKELFYITGIDSLDELETYIKLL